MRTRIHPNSAGGRWAWRDYLPTDEASYETITRRALERLVDDPAPGVNVRRFALWLRSEMNGDGPSDLSSKTLAKFRRLLYELAEVQPGPVQRQRRRREAGHAHLSLVSAAGASSGSAMAMANGQVMLALLLAVVGPVILEEQSYVELGEELDDLELAA